MKLNQKGALDMMLVAALAVVLVVGGFVLMRISDTDTDDANSSEEKSEMAHSDDEMGMMDDGEENTAVKIFAVVEDYHTVVEIKYQEPLATKKKFGMDYFSYSNLPSNMSTVKWEDEVSEKARLGFA